MAPTKGQLSDAEQKLFELVSNGAINDVKNVLKDSSVRVDCLDKTGMTLLQQAAYHGNSDMCQLFLSNGADVNSLYHDSGYTTLMFAALSGDLDTTRLVLENGAKTDVVNSIGRTASQMAAFVGQHHCVSLINNFFSREDLDYYTKPTGLETEPKLPPHLAPSLYKLILNNNMKPVKVVLILQEHTELLENPKVYKVLELLCERMMKQKQTNEVMAMKFHYFYCVVKQCYDVKDKLEDWIKTLLRCNLDGFEEGQEKFIRTVFRQFPYVENQLIQQIVRQLHQVEIGDRPSALDVLDQSVNGQRMPKETDMPCTTCGGLGAVKRCTKCKFVNYCDQKCQKLHWFTHKKFCANLAVIQKKMDAEKKLVEEQEKLEQLQLEKDKSEPTATASNTEDKSNKQGTSKSEDESKKQGTNKSVADESASKNAQSPSKSESVTSAENSTPTIQDNSEIGVGAKPKVKTGSSGGVGAKPKVKTDSSGGVGAKPKVKTDSSGGEGAKPKVKTDSSGENDGLGEEQNEDGINEISVPELIEEGYKLLKQKLHQKAINTFQKAIELDSSSTEAVDGYRKAFMEELVDSDDIKKRASKSSEIQEILEIPGMRDKLGQMQKDPAKLREFLQDPEMAKRVEKIMECALQD